MSNKKATQSFDHIINSLCLAGIASLSIMLIIERANSCPVETKEDVERAKFYACLVEPSCKVSSIKLNTTGKHSDRKKHLIPSVETPGASKLIPSVETK